MVGRKAGTGLALLLCFALLTTMGPVRRTVGAGIATQSLTNASGSVWGDGEHSLEEPMDGRSTGSKSEGPAMLTSTAHDAG